MVQAKLSPRRETLRLRIDRTPSERTSRLCPSPAGEDSAASRAIRRQSRLAVQGRKAGQYGKEFQIGIHRVRYLRHLFASRSQRTPL